MERAHYLVNHPILHACKFILVVERVALIETLAAVVSEIVEVVDLISTINL